MCRDLSLLLERHHPARREESLRFWLELPEEQLDDVLVGLFGASQASPAAREIRRSLRAEYELALVAAVA